MSRIFHCYPKEKGHKTKNCLCEPIAYRVCDCDDSSICWKCQGDDVVGLSQFSFDDRIIIAHHPFSQDYDGGYLLRFPSSKRKIRIDHPY